MKIQHTQSIPASPATVWELTIDVEHWPEVMPTVTRVQRLEDGPLGPGSTARLEQPGLRPAIWTVIDLEPGRRFAWSSRLLGTPVVARHMIEAEGDGSRNTLSLELDGWRGRIIGTLLGRRLSRTLAVENDAFRDAAVSAT